MKRQSSKQSGFTLVEIAIVLVIIGLLLGGVLKGQELITSSKAKALENDKTGLTAAFLGYSDRYKALAGDDLLAATRFTANQCGGIACVPGNGNGLMGQNANTWSTTLTAAPAIGDPSENLKAWQHLRASGFLTAGEQHPTVVALSYFSNPRNAVATRIGVQAAGYIGQIQAAQAQVFVWQENVPASVAMALDSSIDDGFVNLGTYRGVDNGIAGGAANTTPGASYALGATATAVNPAPTNVPTFNLQSAMF